MDWRVPFCCALFAVINLLTVSTGAARLAGVYTRRIATGLTLFNTFILISRMANLFMVPEIGKMADNAIHVTHDLPRLQTHFRLILGSATIGCLLATFLIPTFVEIFKRGIIAFEQTNSLPKIFWGLFNPIRRRLFGAFLFVSFGAGEFFVNVLIHREVFNRHGFIFLFLAMAAFPALIYIVLISVYWVLHPAYFRPPSMMGVTFKNLSTIPNGFLVLNIFVLAFWTVGWMSAVYAGAVHPSLQITSVSLSGIITGVSTILLTVFVDPTAALITDQAAQGIKTETQLKAVVLYLSFGSVIGTLAAQLLFTPASQIIALVAARI